MILTSLVSAFASSGRLPSGLTMSRSSYPRKLQREALVCSLFQRAHMLKGALQPSDAPENAIVDALSQCSASGTCCTDW